MKKILGLQAPMELASHIYVTIKIQVVKMKTSSYSHSSNHLLTNPILQRPSDIKTSIEKNKLAKAHKNEKRSKKRTLR